MAASQLPRDVMTDLDGFIKAQNRLYEDMGQLDSATQQLDGDKTPATVLFLDLVGSTGYRQKNGAPKGLAKAHRQNLMVSQAIIRNGGEVVKWIGDSVMGVFCDEAAGAPHSYRALQAALEAIRNLREYNQKHCEPTLAWEEEIHTKAALSAGKVHFITVGPDVATSTTAVADDSGQQQRPFTYCDPIGGTVDLAARLQHTATSDVIVIDKDTFFGVGRAAGIEPISPTPYQEDLYCELILLGERTTTYKPRVAAFSPEDNALELLAVEPIGEKTDLGTFQEWAREQASRKGKRVVFVSAPVKCNVAGFAEPVEAVAVFPETVAASSEALAVSLKAREAPVRELPYRSPSSEEIKDLLDKAEAAHRLGNTPKSVELYQEVYEKDCRDFRANVRLAQHYRSLGQVEDAKRHWNLAKESDPTRAVVWALAGATYFEGYLLDQSNYDDLGRAVTDFSRARQLAAEAFDLLLEQYCCAMLAFALLARRGATDLARAKVIMDEITNWPPLSEATRVLKSLVEVLFLIAVGTPTELVEKAGDKLDRVTTYLAHWDGGKESGDTVEDRHSTLPSKERLSVLLDLVRFRLNAVMSLPRKPANSTGIAPAANQP
ncbi:MAG TPA: adenylate/guanylate cyclase domain-containing protein [Thermoguttaceae bacterium]|nr:adenylate/guanylate cyclase domain-containing protein [Thermoguttaceae bacterium]